LNQRESAQNTQFPDFLSKGYYHSSNQLFPEVYMKSKLVVGMGFLAALSLASSVSARTFSNKDLRGTYTQKFSGFVAGTGNPFPSGTSIPQSGTGTETADGKGNFTANLVFSIGGSTCSGTVAGTYQVNADGTGTSTGTLTPNATAPTGIPSANYACPQGSLQNEAFTIVSRQKVEFISTDADSVVTGIAVRQTH